MSGKRDTTLDGYLSNINLVMATGTTLCVLQIGLLVVASLQLLELCFQYVP